MLFEVVLLHKVRQKQIDWLPAEKTDLLDFVPFLVEALLVDAVAAGSEAQSEVICLEDVLGEEVVDGHFGEQFQRLDFPFFAKDANVITFFHIKLGTMFVEHCFSVLFEFFLCFLFFHLKFAFFVIILQLLLFQPLLRLYYKKDLFKVRRQHFTVSLLTKIEKLFF